MGDHPGSLFFDPNTGDDMVDKDDLFQEEDSADPQDHGGDEPSSDEDDDIIDLFDTVEIPADAIEEDIIELSDTVETSEDDILELTEEAQPSLVDDDVPDPAKVVTENEANDFLDTIEMPGKDIEEDVIELADIAQEVDPGALDITQELEPDADDEIIDLTEPIVEDEPEDRASEFLDTIEMSGKDIEEDVIELADVAQEIDPEALAITQALEPDADDEAIDLTEPVIVDEPEAETIDYLNTVEMTKDDMIATDLDDNNLMDPVESMEPIQEERAAETATPPSVGYEEDKELLELIDDIQATLNDEPLPSHVDDREDITEKDEAVDRGTHEENDESYIFFEDDAFMDGKDIPQSETDFVDHLGIDLTSEIERKALEKNREATMEDVKPAEAMEAGFGPGSLETAVKRALTDMLAEENNPLAKAIENAVKKALGQGETDIP